MNIVNSDSLTLVHHAWGQCTNPPPFMNIVHGDSLTLAYLPVVPKVIFLDLGALSQGQNINPPSFMDMVHSDSLTLAYVPVVSRVILLIQFSSWTLFMVTHSPCEIRTCDSLFCDGIIPWWWQRGEQVVGFFRIQPAPFWFFFFVQFWGCLCRDKSCYGAQQVPYELR